MEKIKNIYHNYSWKTAGVLLLVFIGLTACKDKTMMDKQSSDINQNDLLAKVNPFIGTDGKGKTYPGATVPYGMVQLSPDNGRGGWDWISGYFYPDSVIAGFSHLHLTGTGAGDLYDISFMPVSGNLKTDTINGGKNPPVVISKFSHQNEKASPGYYQVYLKDYQINVELTATTRSGLQLYNFEKENNRVRLNLGYTRNWDSVTDSYIKVVNDTTLIGYRKSSGWAKDQRVYFTSVFSEPFTDFTITEKGQAAESDSIRGKDVLIEMDFKNKKQVLVKTGISSVSIKNAALNLTTEQTGFDFEKVKDQAENNWLAELEKIKITASSENEIQFYTARYHSMLAPTIFSDVNGEYKGADHKIHKVTDHERYTLFSLWDTYRALHPWMTIAHQDRLSDVLASLMDFYDEYDRLPVWSMLGNETNMMIGYHAVPVLADAINKGIGDLDEAAVFAAMKKTATDQEFGLAAYQQIGYIPYEDTGWSVSKTMEYAYDDWCIAQVAEKAGQTADAKAFMKRSDNYKNLFDAKTRFFRAKDKDGKFRPDFIPENYRPEDYCEANAWQYYFYVPQDVPALIEMTGGDKKFEQKLDEMFTLEQQNLEGLDWISGYIGQYVQGNEPSHHVPYLYQFIQAPDKTQQRVRQIMDELYTTQPDGLCGNEDCGQMSAWYMFSALGFYPVNPADGKYILGSPEVERAEIKLDNGKTFIVVAENQSPDHIYVKSVQLNGQPLNEIFLTHQQIMAGGILHFTMTDQPQK